MNVNVIAAAYEGQKRVLGPLELVFQAISVLETGPLEEWECSHPLQSSVQFHIFLKDCLILSFCWIR